MVVAVVQKLIAGKDLGDRTSTSMQTPQPKTHNSTKKAKQAGHSRSYKSTVLRRASEIYDSHQNSRTAVATCCC